MTTIETTVPAPAAVRHQRQQTSGEGRTRSAFPLAALGLAAALGGGILGAAAAMAVPDLVRDPAAEEARWIEFAERFERAIRVDDLWQQMHPER